MTDTPKDCDLSTLPKLLEIYMEGYDTAVCIYPYEFFKALYPNEPIDGDPGAWGVILCDTIRHIAKAHRQFILQLTEADDETTRQEFPSEEVLIERILEVLTTELKDVGSPVKGVFLMVPEDSNKKH